MMNDYRYHCCGCDLPCKLVYQASCERKAQELQSRLTCVLGKDMAQDDSWVYMGPVVEVTEEREIGTGIDLAKVDSEGADHRPDLEGLRQVMFGAKPKLKSKPAVAMIDGQAYDVPIGSFTGIIPGKDVGRSGFPGCSHPLRALCHGLRCPNCICHMSNNKALEEYLKRYEA